MLSAVDRWASRLLSISALAIAIAIVRREWISAERLRGSDKRPLRMVEYDRSWRSMLAHAVSVGDTAAPIQLIEFVDLECPVCKVAHVGSIEPVRRRYGSRLSVSYVHFPIARHRFARISAQAAECAGDQGQFGDFLDAAFAKQDSFGLRPWNLYAKDAGITDTAAFARCLAAPQAKPRIDSGLALGRRKRVMGTPTFFVNGWQLSSTPSAEELSRIIDSITVQKRRE
jgi:protein-disulfide isomerase